MKVAVVGTGRMGAMARRLRAADVVVYNRRRPAPRRSPRWRRDRRRDGGGGGEAPVVLVSSPTTPCVSTYGGPDGIAAGVQLGTVVAETSTIDPATVHQLASLLAGLTTGFLGTPVSGSVPLVEQADHMVGGTEADLASARDVFDVLARRVFHVGEQGAGATMKLAVNAVVHDEPRSPRRSYSPRRG